MKKTVHDLKQDLRNLDPDHSVQAVSMRTFMA